MTFLQQLRNAAKKLGQHKALLTSVLCVSGGLLAGVLIEKSRRRRRIRKSPGKAMLALLSGR